MSNDTEPFDVVIVGASASGLATALFAAERASELGLSLRIAVYDGARKLGAKILVSGGGRCNVTHECVEDTDFHGRAKVVRRALAGFSAADAKRWFTSLGVELKQEPTGKLFPVSDSAKSVLNALLDGCSIRSISVKAAHRVHQLNINTDTFEAALKTPTQQLQISGKRVVLATGGLALPKSGSDGWGLKWAKQQGLRVSSLHPALVPLCLGSSMFHQDLQGIAVAACLELRIRNKVAERRLGQMLFTHFGISGPVVLDISHAAIAAESESHEHALFLSVQPGIDFETLDALLTKALTKSKKSMLTLLCDCMPVQQPKALWRVLLEHSLIASDTRALDISRKQRRQLVHNVLELKLEVSGHRGWKHAEVTAGGIDLREVDNHFQVRSIPNLYAVGEILDCDGRLGGFNFHWAWATGYCAGRHIAESFASLA